MCSWTEENYYSGIITVHGPHSLNAVFSQRKTPGPPLGIGIWKGLRIGDREVTRVQPPILKCPDVLRIRQLRQYEPINVEVREKLELSLKVTNVIPERSGLTEGCVPVSQLHCCIATLLHGPSVETTRGCANTHCAGMGHCCYH